MKLRSFFAYKLFLIASMLLIFSGCAQRRPVEHEPTMTVCDSQGCVERPHDYATFDPERDTPPEDPDGRIASLEAIAKLDPRAAYDLALRYFRGDGVPQDSYRAIQWMRDAAERGNLDAQKALGRFYLTGLGETGADPQEAEKWLSITADRGDREARELLREAAKARRSEQEEQRWYDRQRSTFYNYWNSGYSYNWQWGNGRWYMGY